MINHGGYTNMTTNRVKTYKSSIIGNYLLYVCLATKRLSNAPDSWISELQRLRRMVACHKAKQTM